MAYAVQYEKNFSTRNKLKLKASLKKIYFLVKTHILYL